MSTVELFLTFSDTTVPRTFYQGDNTFDQLAGDVRVRAEFETGILNHQLLAGLQYQDVETDSNSAYYTGGGATVGDFRYVLDLRNPVYTGAPDQSVFDAIYNDAPTQTVQDTGVYISDQISLDKWRFTLGIRADSVENEFFCMRFCAAMGCDVANVEIVDFEVQFSVQTN